MSVARRSSPVTIAVAPPKGDRARLAGAEVHRGRRRPARARVGRAIGRALGRGAGRAPGRPAAACRRRGGAAVTPRVAARARRAGAGRRGAAVGGRRRARRPAARGPATAPSPSARKVAGRQRSWTGGAIASRSATPCCASRPRRVRRRHAAASLGRVGRERRRSASTCTCRSAPTGATTARSPRGPTGRTSSAPTSPLCAPRSAGRRRRHAGSRHACSSAAARRRWCRPTGLAAVLRAIPLAPRRRGHGRVQPRRRHRGDVRDLRRRRRQPRVDRRAVDGAARARRARPDARPGERRDGRRRGPRRRACPRSTSTSSTARSGSSSPTGGRRCERTLALEPPHVSAYALTVEAGTPLAGDPARHPDDDVQADEYELADELLTGAGLANYEVSNWARPGPRVPAQPPLLGASTTTSASAAPPTRTAAGRRWWNLRTPERYIDAVAGGRSTEAAGETLDGDTRRIEGLQLALRTTAGVPVDALDGDELAGLVERRERPLGAHPARPTDGQRGRRPPALSRCLESRSAISEGQNETRNLTAARARSSVG